MTIPAFTLPLPTENDPENFSARMEVLLSELPSRVAQANTDIAALAAATAGFTSRTSTTSFTLAIGSKAFTLATAGALFPIGASVVISRTSDASKRCAGYVTAFADPTLTIDVTDLLGNSGGPFTDWTISISAPIYSSIATTTNTETISADLTLTSASDPIQVITPDAAGFSLKLPDATTMTLTLMGFVISNVGTYTLGIRNNAGTLLRTIKPSGCARVLCADIGSAAGVWTVEGANLGHMLPIAERALVSATPTTEFTGGNTATVQLSATLVVYLARIGTTLYLTAHDLSTNTIGTTVNTASWINNANLAAFAMSATAGIAFNYDGTLTYTGVAFTVSGTTITLGTPVAKAFTGGGSAFVYDTNRFQSLIAQLGSTTFVMAGKNNNASPFQPCAVACTVSGTVITFGAVTTIGGTIATAAPTVIEVFARSATQAIVGIRDQSGLLLHFRHLSLSGSTITYDSTVSAATENTPVYSNILSMATDEWWIASGLDASITARVFRLTASGVALTMPASTALTAPTAFTFIPTYIERAKPFIKVDASTAVLFHNSNVTVTAAYKITYSGSFTTSLLTAAAMLMVTATNTATSDIVVAGTVTHGLVMDATGIAILSLTSGNPTQAMRVVWALSSPCYAIFYNGRLYLIPTAGVQTDAICIDLNTGTELSRQACRKVQPSLTTYGNVELAGAKAVFSGVNTTAPFAGQYTNVVELV